MSNVVDITSWLKSVHREVRTGESRAVVLRRHYATTPLDLWDAITTPERVNRWFGRIEGTVAPGETIVIHDNGVPISWTSEIRTCEAPHRFVMTWRFNGQYDYPEGQHRHDDEGDEVEVRLVPDGEGTLLELEHRSPDTGPWQQGGGLGWEGILLGLAGYIEGMDVEPVFVSGEIWPHLQGVWEAR